jgi:hypothetical protein
MLVFSNKGDCFKVRPKCSAVLDYVDSPGLWMVLNLENKEIYRNLGYSHGVNTHKALMLVILQSGIVALYQK